MTGAEFQLMLNALVIRQNEFAIYLGTTSAVVSRWCTGRRQVPDYAVAWLTLAEAAKAAGVTFEKSKGSGRPLKNHATEARAE